MQHNLFESASGKDAEFIAHSLKEMKKVLVGFQMEFDDLHHVLKKASPAYTPYQAYERHDQLAALLECHKRRMDTLEKINENKSITSEAHQFLLMMPIFKDTIVSRYSNIEQVAKPTP